MNKNQQPKVSVVIPTYNRAMVVSRAIYSVLNQTYKNIELIVVDDGSEDDTEKIISNIHDDRLIYLKHEKNMGAKTKGGQVARNTGIKACQGRFVGFLDSDDEFLPDKISLQMAAMTDDIGVVHCGYYRYRSAAIEHCGEKFTGYIQKQMLKRPSILFPAILVKKDLLKQIGYLDEAIIAFQEWDTCIRLSAIAKFGYVDAPSFIYYPWREGDWDNWSKTVTGYLQIVDKHKMIIKAICGRESLSKHYKRAGLWAFFQGKGDHALVRSCLLSAFFANPKDYKTWVHLLFICFGIEVYSKLLSIYYKNSKFF